MTEIEIPYEPGPYTMDRQTGHLINAAGRRFGYFQPFAYIPSQHVKIKYTCRLLAMAPQSFETMRALLACNKAMQASVCDDEALRLAINAAEALIAQMEAPL